VHLVGFTIEIFYVSVTILICPQSEPFLCLQLTRWHVIQIAVHTNYVYSHFPGVFRIKSSPTWYVCCVHLQEQQNWFSLSKQKHNAVDWKRGSGDRMCRWGFYVRAFIWSWRDNDK